MSKNLKLFTDDTSRQTYEQSQEYLEPYVGGVSSAQTSSYNTRNIGKYFIDYTRTEHRLSDFDINNKDIIEVEYLESPGGIGAINIDFIPTGQDIRVQGKFNLKGWGNSNAWTSIFAAYSGEDHNAYRIIRNNTNNTTISLWNGAKANGGSTPVNIQLNTVYEFDLNRTHYVFGNASGNLKLNYTGAENTNSFYLYGQHKVVFYYFKIYKTDVLIRDLVPVRYKGIGYMYDKVSRALFGINVGGGEFIIGPDKYDTQIQYLQSTGTQYIDLGIKGNNQIDYEIKLLWTNGDYRNVFGSQTADNSNRFTLMVGTRSNRKIYFNNGNSTNEKTYTLTVEERDNPLIIKKVGNAVSVNGTQRATFTNTTYETPRTMHLFNCNNVASPNILFNPFMDKIYYIKIGNLDLIPVRIGNSGYMYDKLSGRLFGNSGTGEFTLGPDVV